MFLFVPVSNLPNQAADCGHREESQILDEHRTRLSALSPREREMIVLLSKGQRPKQIAGQMKICTQFAFTVVGFCQRWALDRSLIWCG